MGPLPARTRHRNCGEDDRSSTTPGTFARGGAGLRMRGIRRGADSRFQETVLRRRGDSRQDLYKEAMYCTNCG